jgi:hypothetical protein
MTLLIAAIALSALIGFVAGVVWQSDNGPDNEDYE